jgi:hypothetical protein
MSNNERFHVVAIHGVGNRQPGEVVDAVGVGLSYTAPVEAALEWKFIDGDRFRYAELRGHPLVKSVLEVNWDDVSHPATGNPLRFAGHVLANLMAMLRLATKPVTPHGREPMFAKLYCGLFVYLLLWCIYPPILVIGAYADNAIVRWLWLLGLPCAVALITWFLTRYDVRFKAGYGWSVAFLFLGVLVLSRRDALEIVLQVTSWGYAAVQGLSGLALLAAVLEAWIKTAGLRREERLARLGLLYLPFAIISGIGALVWTGALLAAHYGVGEAMTTWGRAYVESLPYDLAFAETLLGSAVGLCLLLLLLTAYALIKDDKSGALFHKSLIFVLGVLPCILVVVGLSNIAAMLAFPGRGGCAAFKNWIEAPLAARLSWSLSSECPNVMEIYGWSALRLAPLLPWFVGPLRAFVDTLGDVLLYLDDKAHLGKSPIKEICQARFHKALNWAETVNPGEPIIVLAHSQGTVIAADVLAQATRDTVCFVTLGSPISSLYWRMVGITSVAVPLSKNWLNIYRTGDYISGGKGIKTEWAPRVQVRDECLGAGRHTGYFEDAVVWESISNCSGRPG